MKSTWTINSRHGIIPHRHSEHLNLETLTFQRYLIISILFVFKLESGLCQAEKIDSLFKDWDSLNKPGGVVAVIMDGEVVYKKAYGAADTKSGIPNLISTPFELASMAKQFTATCIGLLEEQDKLSKEDDIKKYYPELRFSENIRIKNLLDHTSGIREAYVLAVLSGKVNLKGQLPKKYQTKEYLFKTLHRETDLNFKTGEEMVYTNVNYILLGDIVEKVSGMKLKHFADSAIFRPLKMSSTFFNDVESKTETVGYSYNGKRFKRRSTSGGIVGDHNLISTIDDLIIWSNNFYHNKLGKSDLNLFDRLYLSGKLNNGEDTGYGYGVFVSSYKGFNQIYHGGDNGIHTSIMIRVPDKKLVVICLANSSRYDDNERKAYKIVDMFLENSLETSKTSEHFSYVNLNKTQLSSKTGLFYLIGKNGLGQLRKIILENESLYISDNLNVKGLKLNPISENYFVAENPSKEFIHVRFLKDSTDKLILHEIYLDKVDLKFSLCNPTEIQSRDYKGTYINESTMAKIKVKAKNQKIKARKGIIQIPLIPFKEDIFYATQNDAVFLFDRDSAGQVVGLRINAQDFRNFKLKRAD
ncbi:MAG: beta-lactamase family protein [Cyclobacteriaceae bacterium]|nr:beta-lactamase family protein [Cyclobacteriaceae bacterium]